MSSLLIRGLNVVNQLVIIILVDKDVGIVAAAYHPQCLAWCLNPINNEVECTICEDRFESFHDAYKVFNDSIPLFNLNEIFAASARLEIVGFDQDSLEVREGLRQ